MTIFTKLFSASTIAGLALAVLSLLWAEAGGLLVSIIAHPFWGMKAVFIGFAIAALPVLAIVWLQPLRPSGMRAVLPVVGFALLTLLAYNISLGGKEAFAASFAEDQQAGQVWYFGYLAMLAWLSAALFFVPATLMALFRR